MPPSVCGKTYMLNKMKRVLIKSAAKLQEISAILRGTDPLLVTAEVQAKGRRYQIHMQRNISLEGEVLSATTVWIGRRTGKSVNATGGQ